MVISANGIEIAYEITGDGPAVMLIAGVGYGGWFWHKVVPGLAARFQVITFDNRGAGGTSKPAGPYSVGQMAQDTAGLLDALGLPKAAVVGHSLGGFIAHELAVLRPDLVGKLVLAATNTGGAEAVPITPEALEVLTNRQGDPLELIHRGIRVATAPGFSEANSAAVQELVDYRLTGPVLAAQYTAQVMAGAGMAALTSEQVRARMAALTMPVLILFGEHDRVVPPENARLMAGHLSHAQTALLPNTGHLFPFEDPEGTVRVLREFFWRSRNDP